MANSKYIRISADAYKKIEERDRNHCFTQGEYIDRVLGTGKFAGIVFQPGEGPDKAGCFGLSGEGPASEPLHLLHEINRKLDVLLGGAASENAETTAPDYSEQETSADTGTELQDSETDEDQEDSWSKMYPGDSWWN